jgi:hypothetical protein
MPCLIRYDGVLVPAEQEVGGNTIFRRSIMSGVAFTDLQAGSANSNIIAANNNTLMFMHNCRPSLFGEGLFRQG